MQSTINLFQTFLDEELFRSKIELTGLLEAILDHLEYLIRIQFDKNDKNKYKSKKKKKQLSDEFKDALTSCNRQEKVRYYLRAISYLRRFQDGNFEPPKLMLSGFLIEEGYSRSFSLKIWKKKLLRLDREKHILLAEKDKKIKVYDLGNYLLRASKNKDYHSFVLEAINTSPHEKSRTVHIGFDNSTKFEEWFDSIKSSIQFKEWEFFLNLYQVRSSSVSIGQLPVTDRASLHQPNLENNHNFQNKMYLSQLIQKPKEHKDYKADKEYQDYENINQSTYIKPNKRVEVQPEQQEKNHSLPQKKLSPYTYSPKKEELIIEKVRSSQDEKLNQQKEKLLKEIKEIEIGKDHKGKTIIDDLMEGDIFEEPDVFEDKINEEAEEIKSEKRHMDLFHKIYPEYELEQLEMYQGFEILHSEDKLKIYQNKIIQKRVKLVIEFDKNIFSKEIILSLISKPESINEEIQEINIKTFISSQNSAIMYQVNKAYNRLYRARDFVYIRHVFSEGKKLYMIDKSVENTNYPPFITIVRGEMCIVWGIIQREDRIQLIADCEMIHEGYLNATQELNLTLKLLKGYQCFCKPNQNMFNYKLFDLSWDISKNAFNKIENQIRARRITINSIERRISSNQKKKHQKVEEKYIDIQSPKKFVKKSQHHEVQVNRQPNQVNRQLNQVNKQPNHKEIERKKEPKSQLIKQQIKIDPKVSIQEFQEINSEEIIGVNLKTELMIKRELNKDGLVIIGKQYMSHKYLLEPTENAKYIYLEAKNGHPIWKGDWIRDQKEGSIIFVNKKKIEDQKGVLKFILGKIGKNLLSGKSILNISLPVDIFTAESNLERLVICMSYAPLLLERLEKADILTKLKKTIAYGLTNSVLYLNMQKPFNPILGETFQCWINGCPAYAEQISHHPPIAAILYKGRGYQISTQVESKVQLHMNSGCGTNDGIYKVNFVDNTQICFITAGGEVSGLTYGDRKFNMVGKSYYWITGTNIMVEIIFDATKRGFFSVGKQEQPSDYYEGIIYETKPQFMMNFLNGKRREPSEKERVKEIGKIHGIWSKGVKFNQEEILNFDTDFPLKIQYQSSPLPSDSNWREDIEYRRINQTIKAQSEKERLEVLQRKDKKLREKFNKK